MRAITFARKFSLLAFAFAWGAVLVYAGLYLTAGGHGTYVPFALATSPLSLFPLLFGSRHLFWTIMFVVPFWWVLVFALAAASRKVWQRLFVALITIHYATAILLIYRTDYAFGMRMRAYRGMMHFVPVWLIGAELLWFVGQWILWHEYTRPRPVVAVEEAAAYLAVGPAEPSADAVEVLPPAVAPAAAVAGTAAPNLEPVRDPREPAEAALPPERPPEP